MLMRRAMYVCTCVWSAISNAVPGVQWLGYHFLGNRVKCACAWEFLSYSLGQHEQTESLFSPVWHAPTVHNRKPHSALLVTKHTKGMPSHCACVGAVSTTGPHWNAVMGCERSQVVHTNHFVVWHTILTFQCSLELVNTSRWETINPCSISLVSISNQRSAS